MRKCLCVFVFLWSESATTLRQDWTNTCVLEPCKNDASEREERKSPKPGKRAKRSVRVYAANCDCVTWLSKPEVPDLEVPDTYLQDIGDQPRHPRKNKCRPANHHLMLDALAHAEAGLLRSS